MLYLSRKLGESIIINDTIEMEVVEIKGRSVKLGFVFPSDASILRKELYDKIHQQNIEAMASMGEDDLGDMSFDIDLGKPQSPDKDDE